MPLIVFKKIVDLELSIADMGNQISPQQARKFIDTLDSAHQEFLLVQRRHLDFYSNDDGINKRLREYFEGVECVERKIIRLQKRLKKISEPIESTQSTKSKLTDADPANIIDDPTADILDSLYKKRSFFIEQINLIESKNDLDAAEAETLHHHLSQLYESFVENQAVIENHEIGPALYEELKISGEILQKVMSLQTKLKKIFVSVVSPSLVAESHKVIYLNSLIEKQKSMMSAIEATYITFDDLSRETPGSKITRLKNLKKWFASNQTKIEEIVDEYDLEKQKEISKVFEEQIAKIKKHHCLAWFLM